MAKLALRIGAEVRGKDQDCCGRLARVVVDPQTQQVTNLIVERGLLRKQERVLPISTVKGMTGEAICLHIECRQLSKYPAYRKLPVKNTAMAAPTHPAPLTMTPARGSAGHRGAPAPGRQRHQGVALGRVVLGQGARVNNHHKMLGCLEQIVVDNENILITQLVVRVGNFFPGYWVIPVGAVRAIADQEVHLALTEEELAHLPSYKPKPPAKILAEFHQRLHRRAPSSYKGVHATVEGGVLRLFGRVQSKAVRRHAEEHARAIVGVMDVQNELMVQLDLQTELLPAVHMDVSMHPSPSLTV